MTAQSLVLGLDIGTSGVKVVIVDPKGAIVARGAALLPRPTEIGSGREQDAELWWGAAEGAIRQAVARLREAGRDPSAIEAIAVDATSGTIVPVDAALKPLRPGLMYNDGRATTQAARLNELGAATLERLGYRFNSSFALAKILWLLETEPRLMERAAWFVHQSDFITGRLADGDLVVSDESNALKTGFDILERTWPDYIERAGIGIPRLPKVLPIGATIGTIGTKNGAALGLPAGCRIVGGMSDGTAGCAASGARAIGDMNTTLGTTMVWKVIASSLVRDSAGRMYCHRHPGGAFLPGGAGNAGGAGIAAFCAKGAENTGRTLAALEAGITTGLPSGSFSYPLPSPGERFPFVDGTFAPFTTAEDGDPVRLYGSCLDGLACIERWGYDVATELGAECDGTVWTTGKGAEVDVWMQIRADVLNRPVCRSAEPESAFGSALVAAMNVWFDGSWDATTAAMVREVFRREPQPGARAAYDDHYGRFRRLCDERRAAR